jgi:hypothetical protein
MSQHNCITQTGGTKENYYCRHVPFSISEFSHISSLSKIVWFLHRPLQVPHAVEQSNPFFMDEHLMVVHPPVQLHFINSSKLVVAGSLSVKEST